MKQLPKRTKFFFDLFTANANKQILHPLDWNRFYEFIRAAHAGKTRLSESELQEHLSSKGFQRDTIESLSHVYYHGRRLLKAKPSMYWKYNP